MSKRFIDDGFEAIEDQSFTDTLTDKTYYVDYFDEIIELCNNLADENKQLKQQIQLLSSLLDNADAIIDLSDDEKAKKFWEKRNKEIEKEWQKIIKSDIK